MSGSISITPSQISWIPTEFLRKGFKGKVAYKMDAATILLFHPKATLEDIEKSLEILIEDIRLQKRMDARKGVEKVEQQSENKNQR